MDRRTRMSPFTPPRRPASPWPDTLSWWWESTPAGTTTVTCLRSFTVPSPWQDVQGGYTRPRPPQAGHTVLILKKPWFSTCCTTQQQRQQHTDKRGERKHEARRVLLWEVRAAMWCVCVCVVYHALSFAGFARGGLCVGLLSAAFAAAARAECADGDGLGGALHGLHERQREADLDVVAVHGRVHPSSLSSRRCSPSPSTWPGRSSEVEAEGGTAPSTPTRARRAAHGAEEVAQDVLGVEAARSSPSHVRPSSSPSHVLRCVSEHVVALPLAFVAERFVGVADLSEARGRLLRLLLVHVGMVLLGQREVGLLDVGPRRTALHTQHLVQIATSTGGGGGGGGRGRGGGEAAPSDGRRGKSCGLGGSQATSGGGRGGPGASGAEVWEGRGSGSGWDGRQRASRPQPRRRRRRESGCMGGRCGARGAAAAPGYAQHPSEARLSRRGGRARQKGKRTRQGRAPPEGAGAA